MKPFRLTFIVLMALYFGLSGILTLNAQIKVTFRVDMSAVKIDEGTAIGIRGNMAPLSWLESLPMEDPEKDGIYSVSVEFKDGETADRVMYKYMVDDTWDLDRYGMYGNRVVTLCNCDMELPVEKWDVLNGFAFETMLEDANNSELTTWVYIIGSGKNRGLTPEQATTEFIEFWGGDNSWIENPYYIMSMEEFNQSKYMNGYFEEIVNTPEKTSFRVRNIWADFIRNRAKEGEWMGVTEEDLTVVYETWLKKVAEEKGWALDWKDEADNVVITIEVPQEK